MNPEQLIQNFHHVLNKLKWFRFYMSNAISDSRLKKINWLAHSVTKRHSHILWKDYKKCLFMLFWLFSNRNIVFEVSFHFLGLLPYVIQEELAPSIWQLNEKPFLQLGHPDILLSYRTKYKGIATTRLSKWPNFFSHFCQLHFCRSSLHKIV